MKKKKKSSDSVQEFEDSSSIATQKRRILAMVMWYLPIISQLWRLFLNPRNTEMMAWHFDKHNKKDEKMVPNGQILMGSIEISEESTIM